MGTKQRADIVMSEAEIADFVNSSRTGTLATIGPDGQPHLTAMWYAVIDGEIWLETKAKSQKAVNLRRDPRVSFLLEDGDTYDTLRGVSFEGVAEIVEEPEALHRVGVSVWERYTGPYTDECKPMVDQMTSGSVCASWPVGPARGITASWGCHTCRWVARPPRSCPASRRKIAHFETKLGDFASARQL